MKLLTKKEKLYYIIPDCIVSKTMDISKGIKTFNKEAFLLLSKGNRIRDMFEEYLRSENIEIKVLLESENIETLFELACKGMGITVYPEMFLRRHSEIISMKESPIKILPLDGKCNSSVLSVAYNKRKYLSNAAKCFISIAKEKCI